jgi:hypothetical protein
LKVEICRFDSLRLAHHSLGEAQLGRRYLEWAITMSAACMSGRGVLEKHAN